VRYGEHVDERDVVRDVEVALTIEIDQSQRTGQTGRNL
jgi:hypothetical protein